MTKPQKVILGVAFFIFGFSISSFSQEENITITTYYPSPFGSYRELETRILYFAETVNGLIAFRYPNVTYDRRLRITAGLSDTGDNSQGASIDLHGNNNTGRLDLVAGRGGHIGFWSGPAATFSEKMRLNDAGNVGIGTTSPGARLELYNAAAVEETTMKINNQANAGYAVNLGLANAANVQWDLRVGGSGRGDYSNSAFSIEEKTTSHTGTRFFIKQDGNVGIGTTSPVGLLNLRGYTGGTVGSLVSAYNKTLEIGGVYNQTYNTGNSVLLHIGDYSNDAGDNVYPIYVEDENNNVAFYLNGGVSGGAGTAYFGGKVGIGTTDPASKLQISGNVSIDPALYSRPLYVQMNASGSDAGLTTAAFTNAAGYGLAIGATDSSTTFAVIDAYQFIGGLGANSINLGLNAGGGNVGIGTISPGATLDINGSLKVGSDGSVMGKLTYGQIVLTNVNFPALLPATFTKAVAGSTTNAVVLASLGFTDSVWIYFVDARISPAGTLTVRLYNDGVLAVNNCDVTINYLIIEP